MFRADSVGGLAEGVPIDCGGMADGLAGCYGALPVVGIAATIAMGGAALAGYTLFSVLFPQVLNALLGVPTPTVAPTASAAPTPTVAPTTGTSAMGTAAVAPATATPIDTGPPLGTPAAPSAAPPPSTGAANSNSLRRSTGPTGKDTHSWQLDPTTVGGDPAGPEAEQALIEASRTMADAIQQAAAGGSISKSKHPGMAGALMLPNGEITVHTSMKINKSTTPPTQPSVHPVLQALLDQIAQQLPMTGAGHGRCSEVALISDQLYQLEQQWLNEGKPGTLDAYARSKFEGAKIVTHQLGQAFSDGTVFNHGDYRPPCRSCEVYVPALGIEPIVDAERVVDTHQVVDPNPPSETGVLADGQPLVDSRPYGDPQGLIPPAEADQQALESEVPRDADNQPEVHPDPREGRWANLVNDGGPTNPGRNNNCADVGLSFLSTWYGDPQVAASAADPKTMEAGSTSRQQQWLGATFDSHGTGPAALDAIADRLRQAGPGSSALIITSWTAAVGGGAHTWNAVNHNGTIIWVDAQIRAVSDTGPIYTTGVDGVWSIILDANGDA